MRRPSLLQLLKRKVTSMKRSILRLLTVLSCLFLVTPLGGCPAIHEPLQVVKITPPANLLDCMPPPIYPGDGMTQKGAAHFVNELAYAGDDCRSKLAAVKEFVEPKATP